MSDVLLLLKRSMKESEADSCPAERCVFFILSVLFVFLLSWLRQATFWCFPELLSEGFDLLEFDRASFPGSLRKELAAVLAQAVGKRCLHF